MKVRHGFVSNSSSSSFIIARAQVGDERFQKVIELIDSDSSLDYTVQTDNYLVVDTSCTSIDEVDLGEIGIGPDDYVTHYD